MLLAITALPLTAPVTSKHAGLSSFVKLESHGIGDQSVDRADVSLDLLRALLVRVVVGDDDRIRPELPPFGLHAGQPPVRARIVHGEEVTTRVWHGVMQFDAERFAASARPAGDQGNLFFHDGYLASRKQRDA
jgi:hypothetical protein